MLMRLLLLLLLLCIVSEFFEIALLQYSPVDTAGIAKTRPAADLFGAAVASVAVWHSWASSFVGAFVEPWPSSCT